MLSQKYDIKNKNYSYLEIKNVQKNLVEWLEDLTYEHKCRVEKKEWRSKYNHYVCYDYEPFCSDGFEINLIIKGHSVHFLNFVRFLYETRVQAVNYLECCFMI